MKSDTKFWSSRYIKIWRSWFHLCHLTPYITLIGLLVFATTKSQRRKIKVISSVFSVRFWCFRVSSSSVVSTTSEPLHWGKQKSFVLPRENWFQGYLITISSMCPIFFSPPSSWAKEEFVSCLSTPYLTQALMTLKGSICPPQNCAIWAETASIAKVIAQCGWKTIRWRDFYCSAFWHSSSLFVIFMTN